MNDDTVMLLIVVVSAFLIIYCKYFFYNESFLPKGGTDDNLLYVPEEKMVRYPKEKKQLEMLRYLSSSPIDEKLLNNKTLFQDPQKMTTITCPSKMNVIDDTYINKVCSKNCSSPQDITPGLQFDDVSSSRFTKATCQKNDSISFLPQTASSNNNCSKKPSTKPMRSVSLDPAILYTLKDGVPYQPVQAIVPNYPLPSPTPSVNNYYLPFFK